MKRVAIFLLIFCVFMSPCLITSEALAVEDPPQTSASAAALMEVETGRVLYGKDADKRYPMASTTKIMTAITAIEYGDLSDIVEVSDNASGVEGSSIWLEVGERLTLEDLLYGLMLRSGNDAAVAIAEHVGGSVEKFVDIMNQKAKMIGAKNTHFANPHGLPDEDHYTTAYNLALITAYAMKNPIFKQIVSTKYRKIPWEGHQWDRAMQNKNKLLWKYEGANGVKTGYTKEAGRCLVAAAYRNGMQLVAVVLNDDPMWEDSMALLDYGFDNFSMYEALPKDETIIDVPVLKGKEDKVALKTARAVVIPATDEEINRLRVEFHYPPAIEAPITTGKDYGTAEVLLDGQTIAATKLIAVQDVKDKNYSRELRGLIERWLIPAI
ncbi:D-alanyl-D-alanine carboxypeptidase family protein [Mahella sp.]|uniref:D-alanyl-D-alanine carboxypeptidase family protein n=1 Tax=Mahella sp. TaxID=2798721 RepID=UPI0025B8E078|nr:D-alanyl-D-alanine carboxypeptidase family protein [Mahella sp.]MBZ4665836.1 Serine-type D-Ala-D-Ala carboxypeptidase [Mahella sp.]MDK2903661.1 hypothetical protein [Clostridiales bacterium]